MSLSRTSYPDECLEKSFCSSRSRSCLARSAGGAGGDGDSCGVIGEPITCITVASINDGGGVGSGAGTGKGLSSSLFSQALPRALPMISCEGGSIFVDGQKVSAFYLMRCVLDEFLRDAALEQQTSLALLVLSSDPATKENLIGPMMCVLSASNPAASANKDGEKILAPFIRDNPDIYVSFLEKVWVYAAPHLKDDPNVQRHSTG